MRGLILNHTCRSITVHLSTRASNIAHLISRNTPNDSRLVDLSTHQPIPRTLTREKRGAGEAFTHGNPTSNPQGRTACRCYRRLHKRPRREATTPSDGNRQQKPSTPATASSYRKHISVNIFGRMPIPSRERKKRRQSKCRLRGPRTGGKRPINDSQ